MNEELKTLKDVYPDNWDSMDIRQEAIRDIKFLKDSDGFPLFDFIQSDEVIEYIMWKFNITKEDLK